MTGERLEKNDPVSVKNGSEHISMNSININYIAFPMFFFAGIALIALVIVIYREEVMGVKYVELWGIDAILDWIGRVSFILFVLWGFIGGFIYLA